MAEDIKNSNEGNVIQGEYESKARDKGWRPQEEWNGDPEDWVDAREFVRRQPLFDRMDAYKNEIWHLKNDIRTINSEFKRIKEQEYQNAYNDLLAQRQQAAREGDVEAVTVISDKLVELKEKQVQSPQNNPVQPPPEWDAWQSSNSWYNNDAEMRASADAAAAGIRAKNPNITFQELLNQTTSRIKEIYPNKFGGTRSGASAVEGDTGTPRRSSSNSLRESDLNDMERSIMRTLVRNGTMTKEQYLKSLETKYKG